MIGSLWTAAVMLGRIWGNGCIEPHILFEPFQDGVERIKLITQRNRTRAGHFRNEDLEHLPALCHAPILDVDILIF